MIRASICIPTFNRESLLRKTLQSIVDQDFPVEIIVVDDGSSDGTEKLKDEFPIRYYYINRPYYASPARPLNAAIKLAESEILIIQSAEVVHKSKDNLRLLVEEIERSPSRMAFATVEDRTVKTKGLSPGQLTGNGNKRSLFFLGSIRKEHLMAVGGVDEDYIYPARDDYDLSVRLGRKLHLSPIWLDNVVAEHLPHDRLIDPKYISMMQQLYKDKEKLYKDGYITDVRNQSREWGKL